MEKPSIKLIDNGNDTVSEELRNINREQIYQLLNSALAKRVVLDGLTTAEAIMMLAESIESAHRGFES